MVLQLVAGLVRASRAIRMLERYFIRDLEKFGPRES